MAVMKTAVLLACLAAALAGPPTPRTPKTPTRTPVTPSTADSGRLPDDILCMVYGGDDCRKGNTTLHRRRRQDDGAGGANADPATAGLDPEQLCSIFGGPNCPPDQSKTHEPCDCPNASSSGCECVPYYQCDSQSGEYNQDGVGLIDIRQQNKCGHYLQQCCKVRQGGHPDPDPVNPGPTNPDPVNPDPVNPDPVNPDPVNPGPTNPDYPGTPNVPAPLTNKPPCGVRHRGGIGSRISGFDNDEAQFGELPWMVAVFRTRETDLEYLCGGGLIAANVVLTAAHCFRDMEASNLAIRAGEWDSRTEDEAYKHQDRLVDQLIVHPDYKDRALHNDVALLVLREPIKLGYHISTICLPEQGQTFDRSECLVSGWGKNKFDKDGEYANILRRIDDLPVVPHDQCQDSLRTAGGGRLGAYFKLHKSFMCAGGVKGKDACTGDGGSPLVCPTSDDDDARYAFAGVVSWGIGCGYEGVPGVYANVALFRRWIEDTLANINIEVTDP